MATVLYSIQSTEKLALNTNLQLHVYSIYNQLDSCFRCYSRRLLPPPPFPKKKFYILVLFKLIQACFFVHVCKLETFFYFVDARLLQDLVV